MGLFGLGGKKEDKGKTVPELLQEGLEYFQKDQYEKVEECAKKIRELDPKSTGADQLLAMMYGGKGDCKKGIEYCDAVLKVEPNNESIKKLKVNYEKILKTLE